MILKRQTAIQVIEAACGMFCVEQQIEYCSLSPDQVVASWNNMNSRMLRDPYDGIVRSYEGDLEVPSGEGIYEFVYRRDWTLNSNITSNSRVRVNYGMIRLHSPYSWHLARCRSHKIRSEALLSLQYLERLWVVLRD